MKRLKKSFFALLLLVTLIINSLGIKIAYAFESQIYLGVPVRVVDYAKKVYKGLALSIYNESELYGVEIEDVEKLTLGKPFIIYDVNNAESSNIYYFPVVENDNIVTELMIYIINDNYCASMTNNISEQLNKYNYLENLDMIFYYGENELYCEWNSKRKLVAKRTRTYQLEIYENKEVYDAFLNLSYKKKKEIIDEKNKR